MSRRSRSRRTSRRYYENPPEKTSKPGLSTGETLALVLGGVVVIGGIGYLIYNNAQQQATATGSTVGQVLAQGIMAPPPVPPAPPALPPASSSSASIPTYQPGSVDQT
jgi:hypothetical protein